MIIVEDGGVRVEVNRRRIEDRLLLVALTEKFIKELPKDASRYEKELMAQRESMCNLIPHTRRWTIKGEDIPRLTPEATQEEFDAVFERFCDLEEEFIIKWIEGANEVQKPFTSPVAMPEANLTDEQRRDPNSDAPETEQTAS